MQKQSCREGKFIKILMRFQRKSLAYKVFTCILSRPIRDGSDCKQRDRQGIEMYGESAYEGE